MNAETLKRAVAEAAIEYIVPQLQDHAVLGIGTGTTANHFIDLLAAHKSAFKGAVASSEASAERLRAQGISVFELIDIPTALGFYVDGADEVNEDFQLIKGGGGALTREKIVAANSTHFLCIVDDSKWVNTLGTFPLPIEVIPMARNYVASEIKKLRGSPVHRQGTITDNGNHILDVYNWKINDPVTFESTLNQITGVVCNGLFARRPADTLFLGGPLGVQVKHR